MDITYGYYRLWTFIYYGFSLHKMITDVMFLISCLVSHSRGANYVMLHFSKSVPIKKQTPPHFEWTEGAPPLFYSFKTRNMHYESKSDQVWFHADFKPDSDTMTENFGFSSILTFSQSVPAQIYYGWGWLQSRSLHPINNIMGYWGNLNQFLCVCGWFLHRLRVWD